jgi:hypothetical protein
MARILICRTCQVAMKLRDYHGDAHDDIELREMIDRHLGKATDPRPESHPAQLFVVDDDDLSKMTDAQLNDALKNRIDLEIKEFRDDFKDQAMGCYNLHNRPTGGCIDWKDDSRVIGRKTGVPKDERAYLCDYCPVSAFVAFKQRQAAGLYGKK